METKLKEILTSTPKVDADLIIKYYYENNKEDELEKYVVAYKYLLEYGKGWLTQPFENLFQCIVDLQNIEEFVLLDVNNIFSGIGSVSYTHLTLPTKA